MRSFFRGRLIAAVLVMVALFVGVLSAPAFAQPVETQSSFTTDIQTDGTTQDDGPTPEGGGQAGLSDVADSPVDDAYVGSSVTSSDVYGTSGQVTPGTGGVPSDPGQDAPAPPPKNDANSASSEADATAIAQQFDHTVVVDSQTTETSLVEALPDGTFQLTSSAVPSRVERNDAWVDVDTTLSSTGGYVAPQATSVPVRFSAGGGGPIAQIQLPGGDWFSESWQLGTLPTPSLDGATALYADVLPNVDLRLTATAIGMTEVIVVRAAEAANDPRLETLKLSVSGAALAKSDTGAVVAAPEGSNTIALARGKAPSVSEVDADTMLVSSDPQVWDSTNPDAGPGGPGGNSVATPADTMIVGGDTVAVDVASATSTDVTYPLYIDPDWGTGNIQAWSINATYPDTHYWNVPDNSDGRGNQIVGFLPAGWTQPYPGDGLQQWGRSFWQMSTAGASGRHILQARFNVRQSWNSSCASTSVRLFRATNIPYAGASWNESVGVVYNGPSDVVSTNFGLPGCSGESWVGMDATQAVTDNGTGQAIILALAASDETHESWKRFNLDAQLVVTYNSYPADPTNLGMLTPPRTCGTLNDPAYINPTLPFTLAATISDPDATGYGVEGRFRIMPYNNGGINAIPASAPAGYLSGGSHTPGSVQTVQIPAGALPDGFYAWSATAWDSYDIPTGGQGHDRSTGEPLCFFKTKSTAPALPTIALDPSSPAPVVGRPMSVKFTTTAADAVMGFEYWWQGTAATSGPELPVPGGYMYTGTNHDVPVNSALPGCSAVAALAHVSCLPQGALSMTVTVAPIDTTSTLWVTVFDKAGNVARGGTDRYVVAQSWQPQNVQPDTTQVSFGKPASAGVAAVTGPGHAWRTGLKDTNETSLPSIPATFPDAATAASPLPLTIGAGFPRSQTATLPLQTTAIPVLQDVGGIAFDRVNGPEHAAVSAGQVPAGYYVEDQLGQMAPVETDLTTGQPKPRSGMHLLYECTQSNGNNFTTSQSDCEGATTVRTTLGWAWDGIPPAIASGDVATLQYSRIYRCSVGNDHFDSRDANCEGYGTGASLGYLRDLTAIKTSATAVDTRTSFTVSAWVKPTQPEGLNSYNTIVSQQGGSPYSAFVLQEKTKTDSVGRQFRFCIRNQVGAAVTDCAVQNTAATDGEWTFVTGIWDASNQQLRILVGSNPSLAGSATHVVPSGETSGGALSIGSGFYNSCRVNMWLGYIANVTILPGVASSSQLSKLAQLKRPNG
ncbi:LamG-like jellyroll fold domain-containing protein [Herbiconiux sp. 11R-BC]|uniref:LamG-like jellyroll fold domain-containing protein n=1 Tax=Herbiconiux sp. 11R-BC TaxID=3111637 RepID=UPI003C0D9556